MLAGRETTLRTVSSADWREPGNASCAVVHGRFTPSFSHLVGGPLRHQAVGHQLAAGDGDKPFQPVASGVIEQHDAAADVAPAGIVVAGHQRPHPA